MFRLFHPAHQFNAGMMVEVKELGRFRPMVIKSIRWVRPDGEQKKQWVYDGVVLYSGNDGEIRVDTYTSCVPESDIIRRIA